MKDSTIDPNFDESQMLEEIEVIRSSDAAFDLGFKIILLGEAGVGKSSLLIRSTQEKFEEYYSTTIGFEFATLNFLYQNTKLKLQVWDTCGQEVYRSLISSFYRDTSLAILVYSINEYAKHNYSLATIHSLSLAAGSKN